MGELLLASQLSQTILEAQQLRLRAATHGLQDAASGIPRNLRAGAGNAGGDMAVAEHRSLLEWLATSVDLTLQVVFNAPGWVEVGAHQVTFGRMVQWELSAIPGNLKLSVPQDLEHEIAE